MLSEVLLIFSPLGLVLLSNSPQDILVDPGMSGFPFMQNVFRNELRGNQKNKGRQALSAIIGVGTAEPRPVLSSEC